MRQYFRVYKVMFENNVSYMAQYRKNAWIKMVTNFLWLAMVVLTIEIIFSFTDSLGGLLRQEVYLLTVFWIMEVEFFDIFFGNNLPDLPNIVTDGEFDFYITKPISPLFLISLKIFTINGVWRFLTQVIILIWLFSQFNFAASAWHALMVIPLFFCAVAIDYAIVLMLNTLSFWFERIDNINSLWEVTVDVGKFPILVFPKALRILSLTLIPIAFAGNVPLLVLTGKWALTTIFFTFAVTAFFLLTARAFWRYAIRNYSSTGS